MKISELMDSYCDDTVEIRGQHRGQSGAGAPEDPADGKKRGRAEKRRAHPADAGSTAGGGPWRSVLWPEGRWPP